VTSQYPGGPGQPQQAPTTAVIPRWLVWALVCAGLAIVGLLALVVLLLTRSSDNEAGAPGGTSPEPTTFSAGGRASGDHAQV
jgi:hypothetical protein